MAHHMLHASAKRLLRPLLILCLAVAINSLTAFPTLAYSPQSPQTLQSPSRVLISRLLPNPKGSDKTGEWIEIQNQSDASVQLKGWKLKNTTGWAKSYKIPDLTLKPRQSHRFSSAETGINLRNKDGDGLQLFDDRKKLIDELKWTTTAGEGVVITREQILTDTNRASETAKVIHVIDGDTVEVDFIPPAKGGTRGVIRMLGIDTPETLDPRKPVQPFGPEASAYSKSQLEGKTVRLEYDHNKRDEFGRLLAYVFIGERNFNAELIQKGYAKVFEKFPFREKEHFQKLQTQAKKSGIGLWKKVAKISKSQKNPYTPYSPYSPSNLPNPSHPSSPTPTRALLTKLATQPVTDTHSSNTTEPWFLLAILINGLGVAYWLLRK